MQQLKIEGQLIASCDFWKSSAPYRNVTAGEILSDLPRLKNGASKEVLPYTNEPLTHVQKLLRWNDTEHAYATSVRDHVTKSLTLLEQARISLIPTGPGADWRDLPDILWRFPDGATTGQ